MSEQSLVRSLDLLGRVLDLEERQGYRNRSCTGGLYRYFTPHFTSGGPDDTSSTLADDLLRLLRRYETAAEHSERSAVLQMVRRRMREFSGAPGAAAPPVPVGAVDAGHKGDAPGMVAVRSGKGTADVKKDRPRPRPAPARERPRAQSLDQRLTELLKIRPREATRLEHLGLRTVRDALYYVPRDHYDCRNPVPVNRLKAGLDTTLICTLQAVHVRRTARQNTLVEAVLADQTGLIRVNWFGQHMAALLRPHIGQRVAVSGRGELVGGRLQFVPRDYEFPDEDEAMHTARLVPLYSLTEGLSQRWMRRMLRQVLEAALDLLDDPLPAELRGRFDLPGIADALMAGHFPDDLEQKARGMRRLAFDELLYLSLGMLRRKEDWRSGPPSLPIAVDDAVMGRFTAALPFRLTNAQRRALATILADMAGTVPMNRLLQGDVGSGKTVVAAAALYASVQAKLQGAIMAPTEVLAEQHLRTFAHLLEPLGVSIALLTGSVTGRERRRVYDGVAAGAVDVVVGTHALIQEGVQFHRLGLAVVDEQHRFGVEQRARLREKGLNPHLLSMTATPIPRTLSLTIFGDLDVSTIDERPPGRQPVITNWEVSETAAFRRLREEVAAGRQAYVICPLVEENEKVEARAAVAEYKRLKDVIFPDLRVGLVHGRLRPAEKEEILSRFRDGEIDVLVATSVIEVGIDVPNATVMLISEAHRFGLAQLHQFRGRVGRGAEQSYCILLAEGVSAGGLQRLQAITSTDDGFKLAEEDLRLRGPGEFFGTRQSGLPELRLASVGDTRTVESARQAAEQILAEDPALAQPRHALLARRMDDFWSRGNERS
ncbi:MAG TPA: ATP-dependent DNA helicase RecG [Chloroflexota bacterium]|nr:ATP-dependent DNA helicase RecG [Chloroflexota bacterium]